MAVAYCCRTGFYDNIKENNTHLRANPNIVAFYKTLAVKSFTVFLTTQKMSLFIQYFIFNAPMFMALSMQKIEVFWSSSEKRDPVRVFADMGTSHMAINYFLRLHDPKAVFQ